MRPTIQPSTTDARGDEAHPAFGMMRAGRVSNSPGSVLFDSDLRHQHTVVVTIETATRKRDLSRDWIHGERQLIEVEMSEAQWASFVSSMNSSGTPVSLRRVQGERLPEMVYDPRLAHSLAEVKDAADKVFGRIQEAMAALDALDPKAPAKERRTALGNLRNAIAGAEPNMTFASKSLIGHAENVVARSKADIEAMMLHSAERLGLSAADMPKLEIETS